MKSLRFFLIPLLFICGVLLLSLLLRWIASPNLEEASNGLPNTSSELRHIPDGTCPKVLHYASVKVT